MKLKMRLYVYESIYFVIVDEKNLIVFQITVQEEKFFPQKHTNRLRKYIVVEIIEYIILFSINTKVV